MYDFQLYFVVLLAFVLRNWSLYRRKIVSLAAV